MKASKEEKYRYAIEQLLSMFDLSADPPTFDYLTEGFLDSVEVNDVAISILNQADDLLYQNDDNPFTVEFPDDL